VIHGTVEGMLDGLYPAEPERLRPLLDETIVMARLLDDLRTLSMAEAGVLTLHRETVDPRALADDVVIVHPDGAGVCIHGIHRVPAVPTEIGGQLAESAPRTRQIDSN